MRPMLNQVGERVKAAYDEMRTTFESTYAIIFLSFYMLLCI